MTPDLYARAKALFLTIADQEPNAARAELDALCAGDPELRAAVADLLEGDQARECESGSVHPFQRVAHMVAAIHRDLEETWSTTMSAADVRESSLLQQTDITAVGDPARDRGLPLLDGIPDRMTLKRGGAGDSTILPGYRILEEIGRGGMGIVYRAAQERPQREVAIKMLRSDVVSRSGLRRLEVEAEVLARLQHPNIAAVYESGRVESDDGVRAYFVMQYVDGVPIDEAVRQMKPPLETRVRWMVDVCRAIEHAHRKAVIHRDLKPDNVLITAQGRPMVLDFGVARALDPSLQSVTLYTGEGMLVGTLPYMSPEQLSSDSSDIDTRSDVYALGVLAYEVIGGRRAFDLKNDAFMRAVERVREESPPRLDTLDENCPLDLALIIDRAMSKLPGRRYPSAGEMADDLERFLRNEPILARPSTAVYQLRLYARRNRGLVTGLAGAALILIASMIALSLLTLKALAAEDDARHAAQLEAEQRAVAVAEQERSARAERGALRVARFMTHILRQSDRERSRVSPAVDYEEPTVVETVSYARPIIGDVFRDWPEHEILTRLSIAQILLSRSDVEGAVEESKKAVEIAEAHLGPAHVHTLSALLQLGQAHSIARRLREAATFLELVIERAEAGGADARRVLPFAQHELGNVYNLLNRREEAMALAQAAVDGKTAALGPGNPSTVQSVVGLAIVQGQRGDLAGAASRLESALEDLKAWQASDDGRRDAFATEEIVTGASTRDPDVQLFHAVHALAGVLTPLGRHQDAVARFEEAIELGERIFEPDHPALLLALRNYAGALRSAGRAEQALEVSEEVWRKSERIEGPDAHGTLMAWNAYADALKDLKRYEEAIDHYEAMVAKSAEKNGPDDRVTLGFRLDLALGYGAAGRHTDAITVASALTATLEGPVRVDPRDFIFCDANLAQAASHRALGQHEESYVAYTRAHEHSVRRVGEQGKRSREIAALLAKVAEQIGRPEEALRWQALAGETADDGP